MSVDSANLGKLDEKKVSYVATVGIIYRPSIVESFKAWWLTNSSCQTIYTVNSTVSLLTP